MSSDYYASIAGEIADLCGSPADDGTACFLPLDHEQDYCESETGRWWPWLQDSYGGEHSPADEYLIYPQDRTTYGDSYAY